MKAPCVDCVGKKCESVQHLVCACEKLAQKEYKRRHDNVAKKVHWDFCKKNGLEHTEKWYEHVPEGLVENEEVNVLWDINVQCDNVIEARIPRLEERDKKTVETQNGRSRTCSDRTPWKCQQRI